MAAFSRLQLAAALIEYDNDLENPDAIQRSANDSAIFSHLRKRNLTPYTKSIHGLDIKSSTDHLQIPLPNEDNPDPQASRKSRASISTLQNPFRGELIEEEGVEDEEPEEPEVDLSSWGLDAILPQKPKEKHARKASHAKTIDFAAPSTSAKAPGDSSRPPLRKTATTDEFGALRSHAQHRDIAESQRNSISWDRRSATSQNLLDDTVQSVPFPQTEDDTFAPPLPSMGRASRFDPKVQAHARTVSAMSRGSGDLLGFDGETRPRTISGGTLATLGSQMPRFSVEDPSIRGRRVSNASYGSQYLLRPGDQDSLEPGLADEYEDPAYIRAGLLRPKILVMPSPLQSNEIPPPSEPSVTPDGFQRSQNGFPFPAGAVTAARPGIRPLSSMLTSTSLQANSGNNPFTANPRQSLTLSQLTFRNSLMVGGQRDVAFDDLEQHLARAQEDGEQIPIVDEEEVVEEKVEGLRPPGKLFGKSLIDDLEARKTEIRGKQRTFMGDERVSMMARSQPTLVDLNELQRKPGLLSPHRSDSRRRTLIVLNEDSSGPQGRVAKSTSVFGVDTVWERELQKLKEIEQQEAANVLEEKRRQEAVRAAEIARKEKKSKAKARKKAERTEFVPESESHLPDAPPTLPAFELRPTARKVPEPDSEESDSNDDEDAADEAPQQSRSKTWYAGDSDEEVSAPKLSLPILSRGTIGTELHADSDDDDIPLNQIPRERLTKSRAPDSDEEEDKPLTAVLENLKGAGTLLSPVQSPKEDDDDDDEVPLAMRRLTTMGSLQSFNQNPDDDDRPLGLKVQPPWASQHMMPQFNPGFPAMSMHAPSVMNIPAMPGMPFMQGPAMPNPFFNAPMQEPQPPQIFGKIDAWRREVE